MYLFVSSETVTVVEMASYSAVVLNVQQVLLFFIIAPPSISGKVGRSVALLSRLHSAIVPTHCTPLALSQHSHMPLVDSLRLHKSAPLTVVD